MLRNADSIRRVQRKNGWLYIHYQDIDAIRLIMGFNARRIAKNKPPYPVLVGSEFEKSDLEEAKSAVMFGKGIVYGSSASGPISTADREVLRIQTLYQDGKTCWSMTNQERDSLLTMPQYADLTTDLMELSVNVYLAFEQTKIISGNLSTLTSADKLYILGHGRAGLPKIGSGIDETKLIHIRVLVKRLKESGLSKEIRDIRINACESGASIPITSFKNLESPSLSYRLKKILTMKKSTAMILSEELFHAGYSDVIVTGYHGYGSTYYRFEKERYRERFLGTTEGMRLTYLKEKMRASTVRQSFRNGKELTITRL